ncbi:hypothetical protein [Pyrobaculum ferrireducens]|uniref:Uncharacterized protein n=1 Tax=Pyrobaculum ferrireducens TaxID=1104324 RepID=G7VBH0_9CREN|nr:hypothetical protein [Pyrobaculum ferrireducens]AET32400.1 hypothetical protein P186_0959 [Pyrobaculum ferrireducens]
MLSRVEDSDEFYMKMAREALYSALRYVSTERVAYQQLEDSVRLALAVIEKRPHFAKELALRALARSMSAGSDKPQKGGRDTAEGSQ